MTDKKIFENFIRLNECLIFVSRNRDVSIETRDWCEKIGVIGVLFLIDKDYDELLNIECSHENVIMHLEHDIEVVMFRSAAFEKLLRELGSDDKIKALRDEVGDLRGLVVRAALPYGMFRFFSLSKKENFVFDGLRYESVQEDLSVDRSDVIKEVVNKSQKHGTDRSEIESFMELCIQKNHDAWQMCCGHDLTYILGKAFRSAFGSKPSSAVKQEEIERQLRLAFGLEEFVRTQTYTDIRAWENKNQPFAVLRT